MFSFYWPWFVLLLPLPFLVRRFWPRSPGSTGVSPGATPASEHETSRPILLHPALSRLAQTFHAAAVRPTLAERVKAVLLAIVWCALVLALMRPQWLEEHTEVKNRGYDLMLAVDSSRSMEALDFSVEGRQVNRMAVIKGVLGRFIEERQGDRIGLIVFGNQAFVLSPLTLDTAAVRALLDNVVPRMAGDGTAIGDAIGVGVKKLRERPEGSRILILITDGENTAGTLPPPMAAGLAGHYKVRIYTIGVGSKGLVPFIEDGQMTKQRMEIDEDLLRRVAASTGGAYFRATDTHALEEIYQRIDALEKTEAETRRLWVPQPLYRWPLGVALAALLGLGLYPDGKRRVLVQKPS